MAEITTAEKKVEKLKYRVKCAPSDVFLAYCAFESLRAGMRLAMMGYFLFGCRLWVLDEGMKVLIPTREFDVINLLKDCMTTVIRDYGDTRKGVSPKHFVRTCGKKYGSFLWLLCNGDSLKK